MHRVNRTIGEWFIVTVNLSNLSKIKPHLLFLACL